MALGKLRKSGARVTGEREARLAPMALQPVDQARCVLRQPGIRLYGEDQYDAYADEQRWLFEAEGEYRARAYARVVAMTAAAAATMLAAIEAQSERVKVATAHAAEVEGALAAYVRRAPWDKLRYHVTTGVLYTGDVVGVTGGAIVLGEEPWLAVLQALASGAAAITAGIVGQEVKDSRRARKRARDPKRIPGELSPYQHLFRGGDGGESIVKMLACGMLATALVLAGSILTLRWSTEGMMAGFVFGGLAAAVSFGSFLNVYAYSDDIADLIDNAKRERKREERRLKRLSRNRELRRHTKALAAVASITAEHELRAEAAVASVTASKFLELSKHPGIAGHGYTVDPTSASKGAHVPDTNGSGPPSSVVPGRRRTLP